MNDSPELVQQIQFGYEAAVYDVITWLAANDFKVAAAEPERFFVHMQEETHE